MWKILEIQADGDLITGARYFCSKNGVETEGWWNFAEPALNTPFAIIFAFSDDTPSLRNATAAGRR